MDKLKELLNTFEEEGVEKLKSDVWKNDPISPRIWSKSDITIYNKLQVISKEFGFIQRLVDNDKIDFSLIPNKIKEIGIPMKINGEIKYGFDSSDYYWLLMLLSIQDNPIEFLISILK